MIFIQFLIESKGKTSVTPETGVSKLAEILTRQSNRPKILELSVNVTRSFEALAVAYIGTFFKPWENEKLFKHLGQLAYRGKYKGRWETVQQMLETGIQSPEQFQRRFVELRGNEEFFGNLLPLAIRLTYRINYRDLEKPDTRPVQRLIRHRGYRDKGSRRLPHEFHGDPPVRPEREDRRTRIDHPLIKSQKIEESNITFNLRTVPVSTS